MTTPDSANLWYALYHLETGYWREVDCNQGHDAHAFYVPGGVFAVGDNLFEGQDKIREFYVWRGQRGTSTVRSLRTTRHLISNFDVEAGDHGHARAVGVVSFFDVPGRPPVMESRPPILVADLINDCVLCDDDAWRFQRHVLRPVFMGDDVPLSIAVDLRR